MSYRALVRWVGALCLGLCLTKPAWADATIIVDGDPSDWPADAYTFQDTSRDLPMPWRDIEQVWATNDNDSGSNGNLYLGLEFRGNFLPRLFGVDIDVYVYLDLDGDGIISGANDRVIEATGGTVTDGDGNVVGSIGEMDYDGPFMEISVPYSVLGLSHGNDAFGVAFSTSGFPGWTDETPEVDEGDDGFVDYDGTGGDDVEPLSVTMADLSASAGPRGVTIHWSTGSERNNVGFHVYRLGRRGQLLQLTDQPVPGMGDTPLGKDYEFADPSGRLGSRYFVEDLDASGVTTLHGPVRAEWRAKPRRLMRRLARRAERLRAKRAKQRHASQGRLASKRKRSGRRRRSPDSLKLAVRNPGLNRLSWDALAAAGLDRAGLEQRGLWLGRASGRVPLLADDRGFVFVGVPEQDRYADYEVVQARVGRSLAMSHRRVWGSCTSPVSELPAQAQVAEDRVYYVKSPTSDPFYWAQTFAGYPAHLQFTVASPTAGPAELHLFATGIADVHAVTLQLNGVDLGAVSWSGKGLERITASVPEGVLGAEDNQLEVEVLPGADFDLVTIDRLAVDYTRRLTLSDGVLSFSAEPGRCLTIDGLTGADPLLLDVTDPRQPRLLRGFDVQTSSEGTTALRFADYGRSVSGGATGTARRYLVAEPRAELPEPQALGVRSRRNLSARWLSADYLVVTHPEFSSTARRLADYHSTQGLRALVVSTEEVYDHFSYGRPGPQAIRDLVRTTHQRWGEAPRYVLLLGGSTVDSNGHLPTSRPDFVPAPFWVTHALGYEAAADAWYVTGDDGLPQAAIGRLAVGSADEAEAVVDKLLAGYATLAQPTGRVLFVADSYAPTGGSTDSFELATDGLMDACLPAEMEAERLLKGNSADPVGELLQQARSGVDAINYVGHGFMSGWSSGPVLADSVSASAYDNSRPFLLFSWSCFDGAFVGPWGESLAWSFVRNPEGGALLATAASTTSDPNALELLSQELLCRLTSGEAATVGDALREAKSALAGGGRALDDLLVTYTLLGDPAAPNPWR